MKIYYGIQNHYRDITFAYCVYNLKDYTIFIPSTDEERTCKIGDHLPGVVNKNIVIIMDNKPNEPIVIPSGISISFMINDEIINNMRKTLTQKPTITTNEFEEPSVETKLSLLHKNLLMTYGTFQDELPEQLLAVEYIEKTDKILEIGANIGRNSIILSCLLENEEKQMVSLECNNDFTKLLEHNRNINGLKFNIEPSALSLRRLAIYDWDTITLSENEVLPNGYKEINIMSYEEIEKKYNIEFDTIVIDAEGAFYYILLDNPNILKNIKKIIMENDYHNIEHYNFINNLLLSNNFVCKHTSGGGWGPCKDFFYQVFCK